MGKQKGSVVVLVAVGLFLVIAGIAGYMVFKKSAIAIPDNQKPTTLSAQQLPPSGSTQNSQTFKSKRYGIQIQYPKDIVISGDGEADFFELNFKEVGDNSEQPPGLILPRITRGAKSAYATLGDYQKFLENGFARFCSHNKSTSPDNPCAPHTYTYLDHPVRALVVKRIDGAVIDIAYIKDGYLFLLEQDKPLPGGFGIEQIIENTSFIN
jgi:hypothetical protein